MLTCKECGREIKGKGKTGLCYSCAHRSKNMKRTKNRRCACGNPIADWNKTGRCQKCWHVGMGGSSSNVPRKPAIREKSLKKGKCCRCGKSFSLESWQHSTLHWCPECRLGSDYKEFREFGE